MGYDSAHTTGGFKWLKEDKWNDIFKNRKVIGYCIECDIEYPKELHYLHNDYALAPEKLIVQDDWLSPYCKNLKEKIKLVSDKTTKLIPTLFNKGNNEVMPSRSVNSGNVPGQA